MDNLPHSFTHLSLPDADILPKPMRAVVLWNQKWESRKNPDFFFNALFEIADRGIDFRLIVCGHHAPGYPPVFDEAKEKLADKILHMGYEPSPQKYAQWLHMTDVLPVTAVHDASPQSILDAMYCNVVPFLPKRLFYPQLIPAAYHHTFFYEPEDFTAKLQRRIWDVKYLRVMDMQQYAVKYTG